MLERTLVFVDTSYLLASFYNSWHTGARSQLEIDLPEVVNLLAGMIENQLHQPIHRQLWYDGIPDSGPHHYQRALRTCEGVQLRAGQLIEWGERRTQKGVDTLLVADMVVASLQHQVSDMVLVSGDADMIPGVKEATKSGTRVHLYGFGWDSMSSALRYACDSTTVLDPREDFADAMQLQVLEGPLPPVIPKLAGDTEPPKEGSPKANPENSYGSARPTDRFARTGHPSTPTAQDACTQYREYQADEGSVTGEVGGMASSGPEGPASGPSETTPAAGMQIGEVADAANATTPAANASSVAGTGSAAAPTLDPTEAQRIGDPPEAARATPDAAPKTGTKPAPKPSMMAPKRKLRSRYVPLPNEVWASAGYQTPFDVGQQYATWWYENAATGEQRDQAHLLSGGGLPPEVDRPLLQFACETLHEYTLSESQRVNLRDGFHAGIRGVLINISKRDSHRD